MVLLNLPSMRQPIGRAALTIKGLTYVPTGSIVAALTTSLPETPGGERNWDYRYTWMRDSTFTLQALHFLNLDWEADEFMQFVADVEPTEDGSLQIMYGVGGERDLPERTLDHLTGYEGATPVRVGNAAFDQRQNDVFGAVLEGAPALIIFGPLLTPIAAQLGVHPLHFGTAGLQARDFDLAGLGKARAAETIPVVQPAAPLAYLIQAALNDAALAIAEANRVAVIAVADAFEA